MFIRPPRLVLALALGLLALASQAHAMTFERLDPAACDGRGCILASGAIEAETHKQLEAFLKAHPAAAGDVMVLDSPGGDVMASLRLGNIVRRAGLATTVRGYDPALHRFKRGGQCASACVYVYLGGVQRSVGDGARIGVHQIYATGDTREMDAEESLNMMSLVAVHINRLCGNLDLLIPTLRTRPQNIHWLSPGELAAYAVVTSGGAQG